MHKVAYAVFAVCLLLLLSPLIWAAETTKPDKTLNYGERSSEQVPQASPTLPTAPLPARTDTDKNQKLSPSESIPTQTESAISSVTEAAVKSGVLTCARRIEQIIKFLTNSTEESGALLFFPKGNPDEGVFSVALELNGSKGALAYAVASFYPDKAGGCSASYDLMEYSDKPCSYFKAPPSKEKAASPSFLKREISVIGLGNVKVFLMPSGRGCTVIKKEVIN